MSNVSQVNSHDGSQQPAAAAVVARRVHRKGETRPFSVVGRAQLGNEHGAPLGDLGS
jgi:hypothetical protein